MVDLQVAGDGEAGLPRRREPDLSGLATFALDPAGRVTAWPVSAAQLFGYPAEAMTGQDLCDVLMTGPGQRELVGRALAEVAAGRVWSATVAGGRLGEGRFALRCEPMTGLGAVLVIAQRAWPPPRPGWLAEAAARIGSTLDLGQTATEVVAAAVPSFADGVVLYVAERLLVADELPLSRVAGHGTVVRRLASRLASQDTADTERLLPPGEVVMLGPGTPGFQAMATGEPVLSEQLDAESTERIARQPGGREIAAGYSSFLTVPLAARGAVVGGMTFGRAPSSPPFGLGDVALAGELASRAAVCIDNARLYHRERRTALALQQSLLPGQPKVPGGLEVAQCYLPVGDSVVGGDWHDIVPLPGGRAALIVGDVMGHGPEAAAVMVQLRTAAHILADQDLPPGQMLRKLDELAAGMAAAPFATCVFTVIDPADGSCVAVTAGHLPPMLVLRDGTVQLIELPPGLPLGLGTGAVPATVKVSLPPRATLALFTDGLVESRVQPIDDGLAALQRALASALDAPGAALDDACAVVARTLRKHGEDDLTLVLARIR